MLRPHLVPSRLLWRRQLHGRAAPSTERSRLSTLLAAFAVTLGAGLGLTYATGLPTFLTQKASLARSTLPLALPADGAHSGRLQQKKAIERKEEELGRDVSENSSGETTDPPADSDNAGVSAWDAFASKFSSAKDKISIEWPAIGDNIADFITPIWIKLLPDYVVKLQKELSMAPGSLADEIWQEAQDTDLNPEIAWDASVRVSSDLCEEEKAFLQRRKSFTATALARYLGLNERDVHPDDVPTIALCGSGGGLRALVAGSGSYLCAHEDGLLDCVTYTAGVSGSCWLQAIYHSSLAARRPDRIIDHLKARLSVHIAFPPAALSLLTSAPTNKYLLKGIIEKLKGDPDADFGLVDIYGVLLAGRLLVPKGELAVENDDLKLSNQKRHIDSGAFPLPIYTAVRHEIPLEEEKTTAESATGVVSEQTKERARREAWFQWFEMTPYELWSEEIGAGIPTWAVGRKFNMGHSVPRDNGLALPEVRLPLLLGVWGSAFCATLSHYYREIRPLLMGVAGFGGIDGMISERNDDLVKVHPIDPASFPNYALGMKSLLPATCPESIFKSSHLQLMDAGMSNNLPLYPLMRAGRGIDVIIAFDASADVRTDNWLGVADGYARQQGIIGWPMGAGWPKRVSTPQQVTDGIEAAQAAAGESAGKHMADAGSAASQRDGKGDGPLKDDLGYVTVWVGSMHERSSDHEPPPSKVMDESDWHRLRGVDAGIALIYFPLLANPKVEGVDPMASDFMSTWNFVWQPEHIDKVVALARANFDEGREQTKNVIRAVYERKKSKRLRGERRRLKARLERQRSLGIMGAESHHW